MAFEVQLAGLSQPHQGIFAHSERSMAATFEQFGPDHISAIALTLATPVLLCAVHRFSDGSVTTAIINWMLAALLVGDEILRLILLHQNDQLSFKTAAPLHLCNWAALMTVVTLVYPNMWTYELCYFWALGGTLQALLTPDLAYEFPDLRFISFISFFMLHGGVISSVLYLTVCLGMRPVPMSIVRALAWSTVYLAIAMIANFLLNTNFGYLRAKPSHFSIIDYMAPWPFYILHHVHLCVLFCLACYAPFFLVDTFRAG